VELASSSSRRRNGGFPDPPVGLEVRKVLALHQECGAVTPLRVPAELPPQALRRIVCDGCGASFLPSGIEEMKATPEAPAPAAPTPAEEALVADEAAAAVGLAPGHTAAINTSPLADFADRVAIAWAEVSDRVAALPRPELPDWLYDRESRSWRIVSAIAAAALVIGGLILIQGGGDERSSQPAAENAEAGGAAAKPANGDGKGVEAGGASFVEESTFSLALPAGWKQSSGEAGATFSASARGGAADATLWIDRDPSLEFPAFEARSLDQLEALAGSARVVERSTAPTIDATIIRLAADAPPGSPRFEVTLRASGPYRYYLATTVQPDAPAADVDAADLIHGSFQPRGAPE
jgi:hypothetical protein